MRGDDLTSLLVVEFQNTSDEQGISRKYNTYVFGSELINGNVAFGSDWVVKYSGRFHGGAAHRESPGPVLSDASRTTEADC